MKIMRHYGYKLVWMLYFISYIMWEIIVSSIKIAHDVLTPNINAKPGIIAIPLTVTTDFEITLLANLISLSPGTLSLDVSSDRKTLFVHSVFANDSHFQDNIKTHLERPILEIMR